MKRDYAWERVRPILRRLVQEGDEDKIVNEIADTCFCLGDETFKKMRLDKVIGPWVKANCAETWETVIQVVHA